MKNKHIVFSISLFTAIVIIALLSLFSENDLFGYIAQALTLPLLSLTLINALASIPIKAISMCDSKRKIYNDVNEKAIKLASSSEWALNAMNYFEDKEFIGMAHKKYLDAIQGAIGSLGVTVALDRARERLKKLEVICIVLYAISLCWLLSFGFLATIIPSCFDFVTLPIFTFSAVIIVISEVLFSDFFAELLFKKYESTESDKYNKENGAC